MKEILDKILKDIEDYRDMINNRNDYPASDYHIRVCEGIVAKYAGYEHRAEWILK